MWWISITAPFLGWLTLVKVQIHFRWIVRKFNTTLSSLVESDETLMQLRLLSLQNSIAESKVLYLNNKVLTTWQPSLFSKFGTWGWIRDCGNPRVESSLFGFKLSLLSGLRLIFGRVGSLGGLLWICFQDWIWVWVELVGRVGTLGG